MRARSLDFAAAQTDRTRAFLAMAVLWTPAGARIYTRDGVTDQELWVESSLLLDGTFTLDGSCYLGATVLPVICREARVLSFGPLQEEANVAATLGLNVGSVNFQGEANLTLRNDDDHFGKALAQDTFISAKLNYILGWRGMRRDAYMTRFQGVVRTLSLNRQQCVLSAKSA